MLARLAAGRTNRQIATELVLSERTIETHVGHVLGKLGVANRAEAAAWADPPRRVSTSVTARLRSRHGETAFGRNLSGWAATVGS